MSNLTIVLPPDKEYYISYFIAKDSTSNGYVNTYYSNVTTDLENTYINNLYTDYWLNNENPGEKINGNRYTIPIDIVVGSNFIANYVIISWKKADNTYEYVVWGFYSREYNSHMWGFGDSVLHDENGNILVFLNYINDKIIHLYTPGKNIENYELTENDTILIETNDFIKHFNQDIFVFPYEMRIDGYIVINHTNNIIQEGGTPENGALISPLYNLIEGSIPESKAVELVGGIIAPYMGNDFRAYVHSNTPEDDTEFHNVYAIRCKFTKTNEEVTLYEGVSPAYRLLKVQITKSVYGYLTSYCEIYIDKENNKLIGTSYFSDPIDVSLPDDFNIYDWHEWAFWHESDNYRISHIYLDGNLLWEGDYGDLSGIGDGKLAWDCGIPISLGSVSQSMAIDQIRVWAKADTTPYKMDTGFKYYPIPEPIPEPEPEKPTGIINKGIYLVCYKGATSIFDKLIRIVKTNLTSKEFPPPPIDPRLRHLVGRLPPPLKGTFIPPLVKPEHILNALPKSYPIHMSPRPIEVLLSKILNSDYTHVGLWVVPENTPIPKEITYYACREDAGVMEYTEAYTDVDLYKINMPTVKPYHVEKFFEKTRYMRGSMIGDMGYRHLMHEHSMSSVEWVAAALNLAFPCKYTINKLIDFANLEE